MPHVIFEGVHYPIRATETILDGLIEGGADVAYSCRRGNCHTCMLQTTPAAVSQLTPNRLPESLKSAGMFLPCVTRCTVPLELRRPDWSTCFVEGLVAKKEPLANGAVRIAIDGPPQWQWRVGQYVEVQTPRGERSSYSISSVRVLDYYLDIYVTRRASDPVSDWIIDELGVHDGVHFRGPMGTCYYRADLQHTPLGVCSVGTGSATALAFIREAKFLEHRAPLTLMYAEDGMAAGLDDQLQELAADWPAFQFTSYCANTTVETHRVNDGYHVAFEELPPSAALFFFGDAPSVGAMRAAALAHGVKESSIHWGALQESRSPVGT